MMRIDQTIAPAVAQEQGQHRKDAVQGMGETFSRMFDEVNQLQHAADQKIEEFATSDNKDVHGTMIAMQKAEISMRLLLQVRSKLTTAYQEISRMQL